MIISFVITPHEVSRQKLEVLFKAREDTLYFDINVSSACLNHESSIRATLDGKPINISTGKF